MGMENLNLFGIQNEANNEVVQMMNSSTMMGESSGRAVLFLFSKRMIPDQFRRPHAYRFNGEFRLALQENLEKSQRGAYNNLNQMMLDEPIARASILPTANGQQMNLKQFCEQWTFVLIVDNNKALSPIGIVSTIPSRMIYSGWVMDEPVKQKNFNNDATSQVVQSQYLCNESAVFSTTHHTTITLQQQMTQNGPLSRVQTTGDYDYVSPMVQNVQMNGEALFDMQPGKILNSIVPDPLGTVNFNLAGAPLGGTTSSIEIPVEYNSPTYHLGNLVGGFVQTIKALKGPESIYADVFGGSSEAILSTMNTLMQPSHNTVLDDLNPEKPFTFGELLRKYPNLNIQVIQQPATLQYDYMLAGAPTRRNVFTSIIASTLPTILAKCSIAEVGFRYNSYQAPVGMNFTASNQDRGIFQLLNIATLTASTEIEKSSAWDNLQRFLRMTLWPVIRENVGEFDVMVQCSLSGASLVNLQLFEYIDEQGLIETNNLLGGLNTPLIGTQENLKENAIQMYRVVNDIESKGTPMESIPMPDRSAPISADLFQ